MVKSRSFARPGFVILVVVLGALALAVPAVAAPGDVLWSQRGPFAGGDAGRALVAAPNGNFIAAIDLRIDQPDPAALCYGITPTGATWYSVVYGDTNGVADSVVALAVASDDSAFFAGWTLGMSARKDYLLGRVTAAGSFSGAKTYDDSRHGADEAVAVAVDASGASYVTGSSASRRTSGDVDIVTIKYDAAGLKAWTDRFDAALGNDRAVAIAVRGSSVYVTGRSRRSGHSDDVVLIKYDGVTGRRLWTRFYDDGLHRNDVPADVVVTGSGVYVGGLGRLATGKPPDALLLKYGSDGTRRWVRYIGGSGRDVWSDLQAMPGGSIAATGAIHRQATADDVMTASWRADGTVAWRKTFSTISAYDEQGVALTVDPAGSVYVACRAANATDLDVRALGYGSDGSTLWSSDFFAYYAGEDDTAADIAVSGSTVMVIATSGTPSGDDYLLVAYEK